MIIRRQSAWSGKVSEMDLPVTDEQMAEYNSGSPRLIQEIFPNLTPGEREFLMNGVTQAEWDEMWGPEE